MVVRTPLAAPSDGPSPGGRIRGRWRQRTRLALVGALLGAGLVVTPAGTAAAAPTYLAAVSGAINSDGRLEAFASSSGGAIWHNYMTANANWSGWSSLGTPSGGAYNGVAVGTNQDGRLEIFASTTSGVYQNWQLTTGGWSGWYRLGWSLSYPSGVAVARNADGRLEVFVTAGGSLYNAYQTTPNGTWHAWVDQGFPSWQQMYGAPTAALSPNGRLEVVALTTQGIVWRKSQTSSGWSDWSGFGVPASTGVYTVKFGKNADGRLELFALSGGSNGINADMYHRWQNSLGWSDWSSLGGDFDRNSNIAVGSNYDGRLEVFTVNGYGTTYSRWQTTPNGGWVSGWQSRGGSDFEPNVSVVLNLWGELELLGAKNGQPYHAWQIDRNGASGWTDWRIL